MVINISPPYSKEGAKRRGNRPAVLFMREFRPYLTRDAFGGYKRIICRLRSVINAGRSDDRFIFSVKNLQQTIDIISNTDIIRVSNKKNQIGGQENENL